MTRQMGRELHVTDSLGTAYTVVKYDTHKHVTYVGMSMTGHRYGTHSCQVRHTTDVKYDTHSCHVRSYVNDRSRAIHIQGTNVSRTRLCTIVRD